MEDVLVPNSPVANNVMNDVHTVITHLLRQAGDGTSSPVQKGLHIRVFVATTTHKLLHQLV